MDTIIYKVWLVGGVGKCQQSMISSGIIVSLTLNYITLPEVITKVIKISKRFFVIIP